MKPYPNISESPIIYFDEKLLETFDNDQARVDEFNEAFSYNNDFKRVIEFALSEGLINHEQYQSIKDPEIIMLMEGIAGRVAVDGIKNGELVYNVGLNKDQKAKHNIPRFEKGLLKGPWDPGKSKDEKLRPGDTFFGIYTPVDHLKNNLIKNPQTREFVDRLVKRDPLMKAIVYFLARGVLNEQDLDSMVVSSNSRDEVAEKLVDYLKDHVKNELLATGHYLAVDSGEIDVLRTSGNARVYDLMPKEKPVMKPRPVEKPQPKEIKRRGRNVSFWGGWRDHSDGSLIYLPVDLSVSSGKIAKSMAAFLVTCARRIDLINSNDESERLYKKYVDKLNEYKRELPDVVHSYVLQRARGLIFPDSEEIKVSGHPYPDELMVRIEDFMSGDYHVLESFIKDSRFSGIGDNRSEADMRIYKKLQKLRDKGDV